MVTKSGSDVTVRPHTFTVRLDHLAIWMSKRDQTSNATRSKYQPTTEETTSMGLTTKTSKNYVTEEMTTLIPIDWWTVTMNEMTDGNIFPNQTWIDKLQSNSSDSSNLTTANVSDNLRWGFDVVRQFSVPISVVVLLLLICGFTFNFVTIVMFVRNRLMRSPPNLLVLNLAFCDMMTSISACPLLWWTLRHGMWPYGRVGCEAYGFCFLFFGSASINTMTAIAVERYSCVSKGYQIQTNLKWNTLKGIVASWLTAFLSTGPPLIGWSRFQMDPVTLACGLAWDQQGLPFITYPIFFLSFCLLGPFAVKILCYYKVYSKVQTVGQRLRYGRSSVIRLALRVSRASRMSQGSIHSVLSPGHIRKYSLTTCVTDRTASPDVAQERKLAKLMAVMVLLSMLSWGPYGFLSIAIMFTKRIGPECILLTCILAKICVFCNPLLYVAFNRKFRHHFIRSLCCGYSMNRIENTEPVANGVDNVSPPQYPTCEASNHRSSIGSVTSLCGPAMPSKTARFSLAPIQEMASHAAKRCSKRGGRADSYTPSETSNTVWGVATHHSLPETELRAAIQAGKSHAEVLHMVYSERTVRTKSTCSNGREMDQRHAEGKQLPPVDI